MDQAELLAAQMAAWKFPASLADTAQWGLSMTLNGAGASRFGGFPGLPSGATWPRHNGRRLTHLATLSLAEVPAIPGRDVLPPGGSLVAFAEVRDPRELWNGVRPADSDAVQLIYASSEETLVLAAADDDPDVVLREFSIDFTPVLTPFCELDLGDDEQNARWIYMCLDHADTTPEFDTKHLLLGHPLSDPRLPGELNLLHFGEDARLGDLGANFGDLTLHASRDVLVRRDWSSVQFTALRD